MIGVNSVTITGNLGSTLTEGTTSQGAAALSFDIVSQAAGPVDKPSRVWARVNVYDPELLARVRIRLTKGAYAIVTGELMNRPGRAGGDLLEIRALQIVIIERGNAQ